VNEPTQPVAGVHQDLWRISAMFNRRPAIRRRELQAAMRAMTVVMLDEHRQDSLKMPGATNQQPI